MLTAHNVVMTSFIVGDWLDANPTWAKKITDAGHELANHTYTHPSFLTLSRDAMLDEIVRCRDVLERLSGSPGAFFRPSGTDDGTAALPDVVLDVAGEAGYRTVLGFDVDPHDYDDPGADAVAQRTLAAVGPGSIVSLHFGHPGTIAAMPAILDGLDAEGPHARARVAAVGVSGDALHRGAAGRRGPRREQRRVTPFLADQLVVRAELGEDAVVDDADAIGARRGGQPVRDHDDGAVLGEPVERELDDALGTRIEARRGFVEHEDRGVGERGACQRHELPLASRQAATRARAPRCRGPSGSAAKRSATPSAAIAASTSSSVASGRPIRTLSRTVPVKRKPSWGTTTMRCRSECMRRVAEVDATHRHRALAAGRRSAR